MATTAHAPDFPRTLDAYRERLQRTFGYSQFRGSQGDVLDALADHDVLAVMPTGSGKSLCYVLPALEVRRTVVVSPLIALMQDQVEGLRASGVPAAFINSHIGRDEQNARYLEFIRGDSALLYVAPERFANERFVEGLRRAGVHLLAIDEAHCISEWGHDFRPDYLALGAVRERLGNPRTLALTATADARVREDIRRRLGLGADAIEIVSPIDRPNLRLSVVHVPNDAERDSWLRRYVVGREGASGIVYVGTRKATEDVSADLRRVGVRAEAYHAGLDRERRAETQRRFTLGTTPVIVATNAFGMGIDKPDVRFVIHYHLPARPEAYYQEAGRAGRDGDPAECCLLFSSRDRARQQHFIDQAYPDERAVRNTWQRWLEASRDRGGDLATEGDRLQADSDSEGYGAIVGALRDSGLLAPTGFTLLSTDPMAPIDTQAIEDRRHQAESRLAEMIEYAETPGCRRALLRRYFGEQPPPRCENCDNCLTDEEPAYPEELYASLAAIRDRTAARSERDALTVLTSRSIREIATRRPADESSLLEVWGMGPARVRWFGREVLAAVTAWEAAHPDAPRPTRATPRTPRLLERDRGSVAPRTNDPAATELYRRLREWRAERARTEGVPAYTVFSDRTLRDLAATRPRDVAGLLQTWGLGSSRVARFGAELLAVIAAD
ncbi:MAG: ATP-dependent DNA helicase RecQ [Dehalococcoidia bacterium]|nr:ATP-dependent DNA helicase RecQ [Dehalococcoidia bacterium]